MNKNKKQTLLLLIALSLIFGFQNCSDFSVQDKVLYDQGLFDSQESMDAKILPGLLESEALSRWFKPGAPDYVKINPFFAQKISMIVAVDTNVDGAILTINSGSNSDETSLSVVQGKIRATHISSANNYSYLEVPLPSQGERMVLAASFDVQATEISLLVNGVIQNATVTKIGSPVDLSYLSKAITVGGTANQVIEYIVFGGSSLGALSELELNVMSRYVADNNTIANVIFDPSLLQNQQPGTGPDPVDNSRFLAAKAIIDLKCLSCHNNSNNGDYRNLTESAAISKQLVVPGNLQASKLYFRLQNSGFGSQQNMPKNDSISAAEVQTMADWILGIQ